MVSFQAAVLRAIPDFRIRLTSPRTALMRISRVEMAAARQGEQVQRAPQVRQA